MNDATTDPYDMLRHFLNYFHQDCFVLDLTIAAVVDSFKRSEAAETVATAAKQLTRLLESSPNEQDFEVLLRQARCVYDPLVEFDSIRQWLEYLLAQLLKPREG